MHTLCNSGPPPCEGGRKLDFAKPRGRESVAALGRPHGLRYKMDQPCQTPLSLPVKKLSSEIITEDVYKNGVRCRHHGEIGVKNRSEPPPSPVRASPRAMSGQVQAPRSSPLRLETVDRGRRQRQPRSGSVRRPGLQRRRLLLSRIQRADDRRPKGLD